VEMEAYGHAKEAWLRQFLGLPNGIPSHDTFGRVFARLKPEEVQRCFLRWIQAVRAVTQGEVVAIDGKTRRSFDRAASKGAIHMVSAWASANRVVLGQQKVNEKSNEITAIPSRKRRGLGRGDRQRTTTNTACAPCAPMSTRMPPRCWKISDVQ